MDEDNGFDDRELTDEELAAIHGGLSVTDLANVGDVTTVLDRVAAGNVVAPLSVSNNDLAFSVSA